MKRVLNAEEGFAYLNRRLRDKGLKELSFDEFCQKVIAGEITRLSPGEAVRLQHDKRLDTPASKD